MLIEQGYHGTGIQKVLDEVGVPKGSFYNYFESKEEFGAAAVRHYAACLADKMETALGGASNPVAGLRKFFRGLMAEYEQASFAGGCLVANLGAELEGSEICRKALAEALGGWRDRVRDALAAGQKRGLVREDIAARDLADFLIDAWEGAVIRMKIQQSLTPLRQCLRRMFDDYFAP